MNIQALLDIDASIEEGDLAEEVRVHLRNTSISLVGTLKEVEIEGNYIVISNTLNEQDVEIHVDAAEIAYVSTTVTRTQD